jgi:hypothetical protein
LALFLLQIEALAISADMAWIHITLQGKKLRAQMKTAENIYRSERRYHSRIPYSGHIFFATKDRLFEGKLVNFSRYGLFIKTAEPLEVEEVLTIALPFSDARQSKYKGQIVWRNDEGVGVELFKKRTYLNMRTIK